MKASSIVLGKRAETPVEFAHRGELLKFALRTLDGIEDTLVLERATEFARSRKANRCEPGDPLFDYGLMIHSLALSAVDIDSPESAREPFFEEGELGVRKLFGQEEIAYLYAKYELHQGSTSPTIRQLSPDKLLATIIDIARSDTDVPFVDLRPSMQLICMRIMARLLLNSPEPNSLFSSLSAALQSNGLVSPSAPPGDSPDGQTKA